MHDASAVSVAERVSYLSRDGNGVGNGECAAAIHPGAQSFSFHEGHDVVQQAVALAGIQKRQDVRVAEPRCYPHLTQKSFGPDGRREVGVQYLHRHLTIVPRVARQEDRGHATVADFRLDFVVANEGSAYPIRQIRHCWNRRRVATASVSRNAGATLMQSSWMA